MMTQQILQLCRAMGAGEEQEQLLLPLARAVQRRLEARLRAGVRPEDCGDAFPVAAAMCVMETLEQAQGGAEATSFTAGNLSIRTEGAARRRAGLAARGEGLLAPWMAGGGFSFRGVRG